MPSSQITLPYNYTPREYQLPLWSFMDSPGTHKKAIKFEHRRCGKDIDMWNIMVRETQKNIGQYFYVLPEATMGRRIIWEGMTNDGKAFLDFIPPKLIESKRNNDMFIKFTNGSTMQVLGSDRYDSLVGTNCIGICFSEFALSNPQALQIVRPILVANGGFLLMNTTPRGRNHAFDMFKIAASSKDYFCQLLTIDDTSKTVIDPETKESLKIPLVSLERLDQERREGVPEEFIQQEYYCSFDAGQVGSYYSEAMAKIKDDDRILNTPSTHNPQYPVYTACDIGISDATSIWYFQVYNHQVHIIEYNEYSGKGIIETAHIILGDVTGLAASMDSVQLEELTNTYKHHKNYKYHSHYAPHDIRQRDKGTAISPLVTAQKHGIDFIVLPSTAVQSGINNVRKVLPHAIFCEPTTRQGIAALRDYRKSYDTKRNDFSDKPYHNWASHGADGFRYLAQAVTSYIDVDFVEHAIHASRSYDRKKILIRQNPKKKHQIERDEAFMASILKHEAEDNDNNEYALH